MPDIARERWEELYDRAFPQVYRALVAATLDRERSLDALHDAFEEGMRHPPKHDANLEGWLYRVALRKARRGLFRALRETRMTDRSIEDDTTRVLQRLEAVRLLALLTERQRAIVVARYYLGMSQEEIADAFGLRRGSVSATVSQSLARMRRAGAERA